MIGKIAGEVPFDWGGLGRIEVNGDGNKIGRGIALTDKGEDVGVVKIDNLQVVVVPESGVFVEDAIEELEMKAGFIEPEFTYSYDGMELTYLCYTNAYYETCSVQVPFLKNVFDEQMEILIRDEVDTCYAASVSDLKGRGIWAKEL